MRELGLALRRKFGTTRKIFLAASTREGEESLLLDAFQARRGMEDMLLVIVPRHPQRFIEVAENIARRGLNYQLRSENRPVAPGVQVVLGDSMGEMFAYYSAADLAFIGGSLLPFGGQNLIESCAVGTPVLIGPHTYNFADATLLAITAKAAVRVNDAMDLFQAAQYLLGDPDALARMRTQCQHFVTSHQGATDKAMAVIKAHIN